MFRNVKKEEITIPAQMSYMGQVRDFIEHIGVKYRYSDKIINSYKLVIEEACTNIIRHGYRDVKGGEISIKAIIRQQSLTIVIIDQGLSYDPRQAQTPDLEKYIQIGKKGGLGIFMMRKLMDDVQYNITGRGNELRLTKQRDESDLSQTRALWENLSMRTRYTIRAAAIISIMAAVIFFLLYSKIDQDTLDETTEYTRAQVLSLADNSSELLQADEDLACFTIAQDLRHNNPGLIKEVFIVDTSAKIFASSTASKALGIYTYPVERVTIEDSIGNFRIYRYMSRDTSDVYDFVADIYADPRAESPLIGRAHIWVPNDYIKSKAGSEKLNIIIFVLVLLILSFVGAYFLIDRIVAPFHSLADWVRQVGQGTVDEDEIDIDSSDELGEIAQAFNQMTSKFREAQVSVIEQQRLQKELQVAQEIQQMLLPSDFPQVKGYALASYYEAAKEVGGDLFDFVEVDEDTLGICVADVAGKGVPGSLIMTMIRTALRLEARGNKNPAEVLAKVNRFVTDDMKRGMFVTMFYLVLDSRNRVIHYASAGHNPMILYRGSTKQTYFLNPSGFPVGIQLPDISLFEERIEQDSIRLREDDLLVLYTDGITEAMNPKRELYREERFLDAIRRNAHIDVSDFINNIKEDIKSHTQNYPQNDDITFVAVKEKLMQGEVIFTIHKELFRMIEEEKVPVKEACEKMLVSPYMYRKYKKVKDSVGLEGLKELLYETDYIEKKHLSIEIKTKLYDVIFNHPKWGPKRISQELKTVKYGNTNLEPRRIYNELVKAKLNTSEKRERHIKRGGKKRLKPPGTPLLTLDGQVILDYESAEKVFADKRGAAVSNDLVKSVAPAVERKTAERQLSSSGKDVTEEKVDKEEVPVESPVEEFVKEDEEIREKEKVDTSEAIVRAKEALKEDSKTAKVEEAKRPTETETELEKIEQKKIKEKPIKKEKSAKEKVVETTSEPPVFADDLLKLREEARALRKDLEKEKIENEEIPEIQLADKQIDGPELKPPPSIAVKEKTNEAIEEKTQISSFDLPEEKVPIDIIDKFYFSISGDMKELNKIVKEWSNGGFKKIDLLKIGKILGVISTKPLFKSLGRVEQLFVQVIRYLEFMETNAVNFEEKMISQNTKDMLKYIEKENILSNSSIILEQINELGIKNHQLREQITRKKPDKNSQLESVRRKIADKKVIKKGKILNNIAKTNNRH